MSSVTIQNVTKSFGNTVVLEDFDAVFQNGEFVTLLGPSGCGKTTMLRIIAGFEKPTSGCVKFDERVVSSDKVFIPPEKRDIGMVFQSYAVWPHMTVIENVSYPLKKQRRNKQEIQQRAMHALEQVRMTEYANHLPSQLSGGQQQRVAIARALVTDSDVVVMDEPITNLDAKLREEMLLEIRMIQSRLHATILYITHDQQSALQLCDKMAIMQPDGSLCQYGTDEDIIMRPANRFTFEFIGVSNFIPLVQRGKEICLDCGEQFPFTQWVPAGVDVAGKEMGVRLNDVVFDRQSPIQATVTSRVFLGSEYNYFLTLGQREIRMQQSMLDARTFGTVSEGEKIGIRFLNPHFYDARKEAATV